MTRSRWPTWSRRLTLTAALTGALTAALVGCSIAVKRDLAAIPPGQVGFDDMCGLQEYFDALEIHTTPPPRVVSALDLEAAQGDGGRTLRGGKERFAFEKDFQLKHLRRILDENWRRLPEQLATANEVEIEVLWSEKAGTKRVVTNEDAHLWIGGESWSLPYQPCLSELLYGEPLYRQRREMWNLPLPGRPSNPAAVPPPIVRDGGTPDTLAAPAGPAPGG